MKEQRYGFDVKKITKLPQNFTYDEKKISIFFQKNQFLFGKNIIIYND